MEAIFGRNKEEHPEPIKAEVQGEWPTWLQGILLRNGPGMHTIGDTKYNHWFDGLALLHSFTFKNGEVYYRSKYLRSDAYSCNVEANRIVVSEFGTMAYPDPCKNIFAKAFCYLSHTIPEFTDNCLINIMKTGDEFYATSETNFIRKINPQTLETLEKVDYNKYVAVNVATSHPHYDSAGNVLNMGTSIVDKGKTKYLLFKIPSSVPEKEKKKSCFKHLEVVCSIPSRSLLHPSYYHSFGITENYIIFVEQPFRLDIVKMATAYIRGVNWASCLAYHKEEKKTVWMKSALDEEYEIEEPGWWRSLDPTKGWSFIVETEEETGWGFSRFYWKTPVLRLVQTQEGAETWFHFIDKKTKKEIPTKIYTDAMVLFHHVNAYEEDGHIVFDIIAYEDNSLYDMFYLKNLNKDFEENTKLTSVPTCKRFVVPLQYDKDAEVGSNLVTLPSTATAVKEKDGSICCQPEILCEGIELPRINYDYNGKKYKYVFATGVQWSPVPTKIVKFNVQTKEMHHWTEDHCWPSEPIFVPRPDAKEEDDGVVLTCIVMTDPNKAPFLLALDAKTFEELGRATVNVEMHLDLHGIFIPEKDVKTEPEYNAI